MLKKLDKLNNIRINRAKKFIEKLSNFSEIMLVEPKKKSQHVYHLLSAYYQPSRNINRDNLIDILYKKYSIKCATQYYPLYKYDLFKKMGYGKASCPITEKFYFNMISFPFHVWMTNKEFNYLIDSVIKSLKYLRKSR